MYFAIKINVSCFADFERIFLNEYPYIVIQIQLKSVRKVPSYNKPTHRWIKSWHCTQEIIWCSDGPVYGHIYTSLDLDEPSLRTNIYRSLDLDQLKPTLQSTAIQIYRYIHDSQIEFPIM